MKEAGKKNKIKDNCTIPKVVNHFGEEPTQQ
jgi:hypothetical protein